MAGLSIEQGLEVLARRARIATVCLGLYIVATAFVAVALSSEALGYADLAQFIMPNTANLIALFSYFVIFLATVIVVAMWIYRAHANLYQQGVGGLEYTPGWAIGWYFVPVASFFKPFQAMRELWENSMSSAEAARSGVHSYVGWWWVAWLGRSIIPNISGLMSFSTGGGLLQASFILTSLAYVSAIAAALLLMRIIRLVTDAQTSVMAIAEVFA